MMRPKTYFLSLLLLLPFSARAENAELIRLRGFAEHQKETKQFDQARMAGERAQLEEEEQWENALLKSVQAYKKEQRRTEMTDSGPEARAYEREQRQFAAEYEKNRRAYAQKKESFDRSNYPGLVTEAEEFDLIQTRPRYDYRKRESFGAESKHKSFGSSGSSSGGGVFGRGRDSSLPLPPTTFDDFNEPDGGYNAPPDMSEDYGDIPPPPPPPPPFDDGFDGGSDFQNEYIPPPPPPFEGEGDF